MPRKRKKPPTSLLIAARSVAGRRQEKFWANLEKYTYNRMGRLEGKWQWAAVGLVGMIIGISLTNGYWTSPTLAGKRQEIIRAAARAGDYTLAQQLYEAQENNEQCQDQRCHGVTTSVLGVNTELEELVYPEKRLEREITEWEEKLERYPEHRDILLMLAELYAQAGDKERAGIYYEEARILDPNGEEVRQMGERLFATRN